MGRRDSGRRVQSLIAAGRRGPPAHWQVQDSNLRHRLYRLACLVDYRCLPFTAVPQRIPPMNIPPAIPPVTVPARIRRLTDRRWRPQDVGRVQKITLALAGVGLRHRRALASPRRTHLAAACPACNATTAYRTDAGGDRVRVPVPQVDATQDCICLSCKAFWGPRGSFTSRQ